MNKTLINLKRANMPKNILMQILIHTQTLKATKPIFKQLNKIKYNARNK